MMTETVNDTGIDTTPVTVLYGHTTPETAYLIEDYPYGFKLRCQMRVWVERATKGAKNGQQRMVTQTTNPKRGDVWNKPKPGQYDPMVFMYMDEDGHVKADHVSAYGVSPEGHAWRILQGIYDQLNDSDRRVYDVFVKISQKYAKPWEEWDAATRFMMAGYLETGVMPVRDDHNRVGGTYLADHAYNVAIAQVAHAAQK